MRNLVPGDKGKPPTWGDLLTAYNGNPITYDAIGNPIQIATSVKKAKTFIFSILLSLTVGGLSALATAGNMNIYDEITPPPLAPPGWLFPVVWTVLFILMGISAARIFTSKSHKKDDALFVYAVSLALNFSWSIFFFNMQSFIVSFVILVALWLSIIITMIKYHKINQLAAWLQLPYLLWVTFAGYLNLAIIFLN